MKKRLVYIIGSLVLLLSACGNEIQDQTEIESSSESMISEETLEVESTYIENLDEEISSESISEEGTSEVLG